MGPRPRPPVVVFPAGPGHRSSCGTRSSFLYGNRYTASDETARQVRSVSELGCIPAARRSRHHESGVQKHQRPLCCPRGNRAVSRCPQGVMPVLAHGAPPHDEVNVIRGRGGAAGPARPSSKPKIGGESYGKRPLDDWTGDCKGIEVTRPDPRLSSATLRQGLPGLWQTAA